MAVSAAECEPDSGGRSVWMAWVVATAHKTQRHSASGGSGNRHDWTERSGEAGAAGISGWCTFESFHCIQLALQSARANTTAIRVSLSHPRRLVACHTWYGWSVEAAIVGGVSELLAEIGAV